MTHWAIWTSRGILAVGLLVVAFMQGAMWQQRKDINLVQRATAALQLRMPIAQEWHAPAPKMSKADAERKATKCSRPGFPVNPSYVEYHGYCPPSATSHVDQAALDKKWEMSLDEMMGTRSGKGVVAEHDLPGQVSAARP